MKDWRLRVERLSLSLLDAGVDWNPWTWNPVVRVRRGTRMPPELLEEIESCLGMLRAVVRLTTTSEQLRDFVRKCEDHARTLVSGPDSTLAERWRELAARTAETGTLHLEEADALAMEKLGERAFRFEVVEPGEGWPPSEPSLPGPGLNEPDRAYAVKATPPRPRPAAALRSLGALLRAWRRE